MSDLELIKEIRKLKGLISHDYMMARTNVPNPRAYLNRADKNEKLLRSLVQSI